MADVLRRILYPAFVLTIVATIWVMGQAQAASDGASRDYWAPVHPSITGVPVWEEVPDSDVTWTTTGTAPYGTDATAGAGSFDEVLLEYD